jgi:hypothetical protein
MVHRGEFWIFYSSVFPDAIHNFLCAINIITGVSTLH